MLFRSTSLTKAIATLTKALQAAARAPKDEFIRDACIQRFEYTYELCVKSLRRQLTVMSDSPSEIDGLGYRDMIRMGVERGFIKSEKPWFGYRELRNITSHVYDPAKARKVFNALRRFQRDAKALHDHLLKASK